MERTSRIAPLPEPWSEEDEASILRWRHPENHHDPLLLTRVLQRHPKIARRLRDMGQSIYLSGQLDAHDRQVAIMRICALVRCEYEWGGQAAFWGPRTGLSEADCDALVLSSADDVRWTEREVAVIAAVDELEETGSWGEDTWATLRTWHSEEAMLELLAAIGWYRTICTYCNTLALDLEPWMRRWPAGAFAT
ncbi:MAG: carboxymuconolactone decarboxylase family protein [Solirubrobacteraceae bacterium]|nr:carboxymuconolactone decarboxylase family protein [Solirubrobacteraceae bacterium]